MTGDVDRSWPHRGPFGEAVVLEHRHDRSYDESDVSVLLHPNGSTISSQHRPLNAAMAREVLRLRGVTVGDVA